MRWFNVDILSYTTFITQQLYNNYCLDLLLQLRFCHCRRNKCRRPSAAHKYILSYLTLVLFSFKTRLLLDFKELSSNQVAKLMFSIYTFCVIVLTTFSQLWCILHTLSISNGNNLTIVPNFNAVVSSSLVYNKEY